MLKENKSQEKSCLFYASDYHFEMITLPYINKKIKENNEIVVVTENNLEETIKVLLSRINIKEKEKDDILKLDWKVNNFDKFNQIKKANKEDKDTIVFIKGKENYVENVNKNIENWVDTNKIKIIDCYDINEIEENVSEIARNYKTVLSTTGMKKM